MQAFMASILTPKNILVIAVIVGLAASTIYYAVQYMDASSRLGRVEEALRQEIQIDILNLQRTMKFYLPSIKGLRLDYVKAYCSNNTLLINATVMKLKAAGNGLMQIQEIITDARLSIGVLMTIKPNDKVLEAVQEAMGKYGLIMTALTANINLLETELEARIRHAPTPGNCSLNQEQGLKGITMNLQSMIDNLDILESTINKLGTLRSAVLNNEYSPVLDELNNELDDYIRAAGIPYRGY